MRCCRIVFAAPQVYPFPKPFYDTPHDEDRGWMNTSTKARWPEWMNTGADGTGRGLGLHRTHPLSRQKGNFRRGRDDIDRVFSMMMKGVYHKSGSLHYYRGGKPPNPSKHPYVTGRPCAVYGWQTTEEHLIRQFNTPHVSKDQFRYKPYVALHEKSIVNATQTDDSDSARATEPAKVAEGKPLLKRLFFWK